VALTARNRWLLLGGTLALTLAAARFVGGEDAVPAAASGAATEPPAPARQRPAPPEPEVALDRLAARTPRAPEADPFRALSWQTPVQAEARKSVPATPPARPQAPPLPFTYMGKLLEDGKTTVFLVQGERNLIVRAGDTIDGTYRVDRIGEHAMTITYLPLGQAQQLALGGAQ
jgi:hypothetical protein